MTGKTIEKLANIWDINPKDMPMLIGHVPRENKVMYVQESIKDVKPADLSVENITTFAGDVVAGKVQPPPMKTQAIPETNDEPVKVIVGKAFRSWMSDKTKDVLIHFFDSENEDCKKLEPLWNDLAVSLDNEENKNFVIAKFDGIENETKMLKIKKFPTIMFFPKGNKMGLTYSGDPLDTDAVLTWAK